MTVASFNLYCMREDQGRHVMPFEERVEHIARYIVEQRVDVIGLQEACVPLAEGRGALDILVWRVREISGDSRYQSAFVETHQAWGAFREGIGLITRFNMNDIRGDLLNSLPEFFPRRVLAATLDTPAGRMRFLVTHLTAVWGDRQRHGQASRARETHELKLGAARATPDHDFVVVVGDFNSSPGDEPHGLMLGDAEGLSFRDALPNVGGTIPSWNPGPRIDHIFVRGDVEIARGRRVLDQPINGKYLSDHNGVEATVMRR